MTRIAKQTTAIIIALIIVTITAGCKSEEVSLQDTDSSVTSEQPAHISEPSEKTVITLAGIYVDNYIQEAVAEFNKTNLHYRIEVKDYRTFNTELDRSAGLTRLITEISSGTVPDILETKLLQGMNFESKGLYADLYPFIDADPDFSRSDFIQPVLGAVETDGKLYEIFPGFEIDTVIGHPSILGSDPYWNLDDFEAVLNANPDADLPMGYSVTKAEIFKKLLCFNIDNYIDLDTGTVSFDSEDFIRILGVCDRFPADAKQTQDERDADAIKTGRQIMAGVSIYSQLAPQRERLLGRAWLDGEFVYKGYPTAQGSGHGVRTMQGLAIIENSPHKDAAWLFVRKFLDPEWQFYNAIGFPSATLAYDRQREYFSDENNALGTISDGIMTVVLEPASQEDIDFIYGLIYALAPGSKQTTDEALLDIIAECASEYFSGICSAEDAALNIQNLVSIYVSERS